VGGWVSVGGRVRAESLVGGTLIGLWLAKLKLSAIKLIKILANQAFCPNFEHFSWDQSPLRQEAGPADAWVCQ